MENKQILICPDSFKGTLTAEEVADTIEKAIKDVSPAANTRVCRLPTAAKARLNVSVARSPADLSASARETATSVPARRNTFVARVRDRRKRESNRTCLNGIQKSCKTTSYGVGVIIDDALMRTKDIVLALGGSSTNDGGAGIAAALGVKFSIKAAKPLSRRAARLKTLKNRREKRPEF